jgi:hypothetical protein
VFFVAFQGFIIIRSGGKYGTLRGYHQTIDSANSATSFMPSKIAGTSANKGMNLKVRFIVLL